jgi:hypothetical protein
MVTEEGHGVLARAFLGRRSQGRQASDAKGSTPSTTERRERCVLQRASSGVGGAALRAAGADAAQGRA